MSTRDDNQSMFNPSADWMEQQRKFGKQEAITALVQERDALKARVAELEGDVARDAARYRWLTEDHPDAQTRKERRNLLDRMPVMSYSAASRDIDAAIASAKEPSHD